MRCPKCGAAKTKVTNVPAAAEHPDTRRRHCKTCDARFITVEQVVGEDLLCLSADEHRQVTAHIAQLLRLLRYR